MLKSDTEVGTVAVGGENIAFSVIRSRRRKRTIAFRLETDSHLRVLAPFSASLKAVANILQKRAPWIVRQRLEQKKAIPRCDFSDGSVLMYLGYACVLRVTQGEGAPPSCVLSPHRIHVHVPDTTLSREGLGQEARLEIMLWMKKRARILFKKRMDLWAGLMGVRYKKLMVTDPERRWGSCSVDNSIRLNWRLIRVPLAVLDYVVVHELAHIVHKNHSPRFWSFIASVLPDYQQRRQCLRQIERGVYDAM